MGQKKSKKQKQPQINRSKAEALVEYDPIRMSQIDMTVLNELPPSLKQDVLLSIDPSKIRPKSRKSHNKRCSTINKKERMEQGIQECNIRFGELIVLLSGAWSSAACLLHSGNITSCIAELDKYLSSMTDNSESLEKSFGVFKEITANEISHSFSIPLRDMWVLARGIRRLGIQHKRFSSYAEVLEGIIQNEIESRYSAGFDALDPM